MPHDHHHHHHHGGEGRLSLAIAVNLLLTVAQIIGGIVSGSLAMIADALHNFSDAMSLVIATVARRIAKRPADARMSFGYARAEVVAALINYTTLIVIGLYLLYEAGMRFLAPEPVAGWMVVIIAGLALVIDLVTAALTYSMAKDSVNIRAAFMHNVADALGSVAVIFAGTVIILFGWTWVDPAVTVLIAGYILWMAFSEIGSVIRILMLGAPDGLDADAVLHRIQQTNGVQGVHNAHIWLIDERKVGLLAHVVVSEGHWGQADAIKADLKARLHTEFGIDHMTIEVECTRHSCVDAPLIGAGGHQHNPINLVAHHGK
ncbi:cation diffusion facilitator family transporter [Pseudoprimorskyibacter insulae]|uniref:Cadmium, cobalt and zinc/H(+)-K(+) antiporter n=1 Tax=Pseudoprimorskyibacter insulae TaxID=1695997 RepID=A0A2R8B1E0_9RHOB|nr:cation diffusion facilitator family transporter [Pseudoprimorskyibacter insulae]SPF82057.1 Cadmium, cobalt and zinc/H(+)-K(+) antiporter [Pseudoprimorskyibacter insulae]